MWNNWSVYFNQLQSLYRRNDDPKLREALREMHRNQSIPHPDMQHVLDMVLGSIDETLTYPALRAQRGEGINFGTRFEILRLQQIASAIRERLPILRAIADAHPTEYPDLVDAEDWRDMTLWDTLNAYIAEDILVKLLRAHQANATYTATELSFTIEDYRSEHGAYPETLDALVPKYCDAVPTNPLTHQPFNYTRVDDNKGYAIKGEIVDMYKWQGGMSRQNLAGYVKYWRKIYRD